MDLYKNCTRPSKFSKSQKLLQLNAISRSGNVLSGPVGVRLGCLRLFVPYQVSGRLSLTLLFRTLEGLRSDISGHN